MGRPKLDLTDEERLQRRKDQLRRANEKRRLSRKRRVENLPLDKIEKERRKKREYYLFLKKNKEEKKLKEMGTYVPADINKEIKCSNVKISGTPLISSKYQIGYNLEFTKINGDANSLPKNIDIEKVKITGEDTKEIGKEEEHTVNNWKSLKWICYYCDSVLNEYESLSSHLVEMHGVMNAEDISFQCNDCKEPLLGYALFLNHMRSKHHSILKLCCDVCNDILPDYQQLTVHRDKHIETSSNIFPTVYHCTLCEYVHSTEKVLKSHIELCHTLISVDENLKETLEAMNEKRAENFLDPIYGHAAVDPVKCKEEYDETQQIFQCGKCVKSFDTEINLEQHMNMHTGDQPFECEICQKSFSKTVPLRVHKETHAEDHRFKCEICSKGFLSKTNFMIHLKTHTGECFKCDICPEKFLYRSNLLLHKRRHTKERPFKCEICQKSISTQQYLKIHMRIHSTERPFKCDLCDKTFKFKNARNSHMIHRHSDDRPHSCTTCKKRFKTIQEIRKHTVICLKRIKEKYSNIHETSTQTYESSSCEISSSISEDEKSKVFLGTFKDNKYETSLQPFENKKWKVL